MRSVRRSWGLQRTDRRGVPLASPTPAGCPSSAGHNKCIMSPRRAGCAPPSERRGTALKQCATRTVLPAPAVVVIAIAASDACTGNTVLITDGGRSRCGAAQTLHVLGTSSRPPSRSAATARAGPSLPHGPVRRSPAARSGSHPPRRCVIGPAGPAPAGPFCVVNPPRGQVSAHPPLRAARRCQLAVPMLA